LQEKDFLKREREREREERKYYKDRKRRRKNEIKRQNWKERALNIIKEK